MSDLFSWANEQDEKGNSDSSEEAQPAAPYSPPKALTVTQLNHQLKATLEDSFSGLLLEGEISNFKAHTSGHFYFSLKDDQSQINAAMFRGSNSHLKFSPRDGLKVLVRGNVSLYPPRGQYQIIVTSMEPLGEGALRLAFEQLKEKLQKEGLFDPRYKVPLPVFPKKIAIVTSPTGAAIRDILNVLSRRFPHVHILLFPCRVQGKEATEEFVQAIRTADQWKADVMIVGRGGGSLEDLWCFNEESVARALFACQTPVVSAVGHEIDFTIADFVADMRAPTPSAAAELVVPNKMDLLLQLRTFEGELLSHIRTRLSRARQRITDLQRGLVDPRKKIQDGTLRLEDLSKQLVDWMKNHLRRKNEILNRHSQILDSLSPLAVLSRGYSVVMHEGKVLLNSDVAKNGDILAIRLHHGSLQAAVKK